MDSKSILILGALHIVSERVFKHFEAAFCTYRRWGMHTKFIVVMILPCMYIKSLCCTPYTRTVLFVNYISVSFFLFMAAPAAYGSSWARVQIRAAAVSNSHSNPDPSYVCHLRCSLWQRLILNPLIKARSQTRILTDTMSGSWPIEPQQELLSIISQ